QGLVDQALVLLAIARNVGVVDAQREAAGVCARKKDVVQGGARCAQVREAGRARRDAHANLRCVRHRHKIRSGHMPGLLALVGGDEFKPGNEEQDRLMVAAAGTGPAYVVPTAAARQGPESAVAHATEWFGGLGLTLRELPILKRSDAMKVLLAEEAARGGFFYLAGGDPGHVAQVLHGYAVWRAMFGVWRAGAVLAGSSAGALALCSHTLVRATWPN